MILNVSTPKEIRKFVRFTKDLYKHEKNYVFTFFNKQIKELKKLILEDQTYYGLLSVRNNVIMGRLLYTFLEEEGKTICYFSFFDFYNDYSVSSELFDALKVAALAKGAESIVGPYFPNNEDFGKGVLTNCYDKVPALFMPYNPKYYVFMYKKLGLVKKTDLFSINVNINEIISNKIDRLKKIDHLDNIVISEITAETYENDILDITKIINECEGKEINPESVKEAIKKKKMFIKNEYTVIAREKDSNKAVAFVMVSKDFSQVFIKMKGRFDIFKYLINKNKITKARGLVQYILPDFESSLIIIELYIKAFENLFKDNIVEFESATMSEDNVKAYRIFGHFGGEVDKVYRLYCYDNKQEEGI